jgi:uncharacterized protein (TIGR00251 family)
MLLRILVQPRASRTEIVGLYGDAIRIRLAAPPVDGAANEELILFLAGQLKVSKAAVTITSGLSSRRKMVSVVGVTENQVRRLIKSS